MRKGRDREKREKREKKKKGTKKEKTDENSGHYVIASSPPPERRPLERRTLAPIATYIATDCYRWLHTLLLIPTYCYTLQHIAIECYR